MTALNWYGIAGLTLILVVFYLVRRIPIYLAICVAITAACAVATGQTVDWQRPSEWVVASIGLWLCVFGLLIVRVMLIRSVSLRLLDTIQRGNAESVSEDIGGRLDDMRSFGLIRPTGEMATLSAFGRLISGIVAVFYAMFRI
jgi:hypothetical protein